MSALPSEGTLHDRVDAWQAWWKHESGNRFKVPVKCDSLQIVKLPPLPFSYTTSLPAPMTTFPYFIEHLLFPSTLFSIHPPMYPANAECHEIHELARFQWGTNNLPPPPPFRFLSSCVGVTFDNFSKLSQLPSVEAETQMGREVHAWILLLRMAVCVCFVCVRVCSRDPSGLVGSCS